MPTKTMSLPNSETVTRTTLDNGITILVYENPNVHSVVLAGSIHAGALYVSPSQAGLASMTANCLMLGTQSRDFDAIHSSLEEIGADLSLHAGGHKVGFSGKALAEDFELLVDLLNDTLRNPLYPEDQVERRRGEILTWLHYREQDTRWQSANAFRRTLYPETHPYHHSVRGTLETIPSLSIEDMKAFHRNQYGPRGAVIVVVGAVNSDDVIATITQYLGDWKNPNQPEIPSIPDVKSPTEMTRINIAIPGKMQSDIIIGTVGPSRFAPNYQAANLANSILGQFGMMGRVGQVIREQAGLAYYVYSRLDGGYGPGAWSISAGVHPDNVEQAINMAIDELRLLIKEAVSEDDLADNQSYFTGRLPLQLESSEGVAGTLLTIENFNLGLDYLSHYHDMIHQLTTQQLLAATQQYLNPDALVITVAGPAENK